MIGERFPNECFQVDTPSARFGAQHVDAGEVSTRSIIEMVAISELLLR